MTTKIFRSLLSALVVISGASFMLSCGGDDNDGDARDCNAFATAVSKETSDWSAALLSGDCEQIEDAYNELIDAYKDGKGCNAVEKHFKDLDFTYEEWIDDLEESRDLILADC